MPLSDQYISHAWSIDGGEWKAPHPYVEGVRVTWRGARLVCTKGHYCGGSAVHPWDPGDCWRPQHAALLWSPDGPDAVSRLYELDQADELPEAGVHAANGTQEGPDLREDPTSRRVACISSGGHYWDPATPEGEPPTCTRCAYNPGWLPGGEPQDDDDG